MRKDHRKWGHISFRETRGHFSKSSHFINNYCVGEIDYRSKLRDLCCECVAALARDVDNRVLQQIVANRRGMLTPVFQEYASVHQSVERLTSQSKVSVLTPIFNSLDISNNNIPVSEEVNLPNP